MKKWIAIFLMGWLSNYIIAQKSDTIEMTIDKNIEFQVIRNFGASDAWASQFVGLWPESKKNKIADWLFSMDTSETGSPLGIGLSVWRFNIGAGSASQGEDSGIKDSWRRAEGFLQNSGQYNWKKQAGQQWFLQAAKDRGVEQFIAFVNSPPVQLTKNNKAHSSDGLSSNLAKDKYVDYADFLANVMMHFKDSLGLSFNYVSPFNEPQWEWKGNQEGTPWNNDELATATRVIDSVFRYKKIDSKIEITEAGQIDYLTGEKEKYRNRSNQIETFFSPESSNYLADLKTVAPKIAGHSYFTTWDIQKLKSARERIAEKLNKYPSLEYWMSEYCILENNEEIKGQGKDLGMQTALYLARVIHADLTIANASAWHWWLAISPYNYKDGLVYVDKETSDGSFFDSKLLWVLGNYSRFIRPGAKRILVEHQGYNQLNNLKEGVLISAYKNSDSSIVVVVVNQHDNAVNLKLNNNDLDEMQQYVTDNQHNLQNIESKATEESEIKISGKSVTTLVFKN
ncbi:glycoside hydrolase [Formosa undariae]|uniref:Glycoside hydrolase n=1 Tax=Formosa undariae TaxID=1325436 RepID=A0ABV5EZX4_9FLAO